MTDGETLIDQALAAVAAGPRPGKLGEGIEITPMQALVWVIYLAVQDRHEGRGSDAQVERYVRTARSAGIPEAEIQAAITAAGG